MEGSTRFCEMSDCVAGVCDGCTGYMHGYVMKEGVYDCVEVCGCRVSGGCVMSEDVMFWCGGGVAV